MSKELQYLPDYLRTNAPNECVKWFFDQYSKIPSNERRVVEIGTRRWNKNPTHHKSILEPALAYLMVDFMEGEDVDAVIDAHELADKLGDETVSCVWTSSTFEHLHSPWEAAKQILRVLKPGGLFFVQTHLCFPEHGYPDDYFRFTRMGLERLFKSASEKHSCYDFEAKLTPQDALPGWNHAAKNWLNVCVVGRK